MGVNDFGDKVGGLRSKLRPALGIDLGTQNTVVCNGRTGKILSRHPTLVARNKKTGQLFFGLDAEKKLGMVSQTDYEFIPLLKDGTIKKDHDTLVNEYLRFILGPHISPLNKPNVVFAVSCRLKERDLKSVEYAAAPFVNKSHYIYQPFAAALAQKGIRKDCDEVNIKNDDVIMVCDIGHGTTDWIAWTIEGYLDSHASDIAGHEMDEAIIHYMSNELKVPADNLMAKRLKHELGSAIIAKPELYLPLRSLVSGEEGKTFREITVTDQDIAIALDSTWSKIEVDTFDFLAKLTTQSASLTTTRSDKTEHERNAKEPDHLRIYLGGGCSMVRRCDERFENNMRIKTTLIKDPLDAASIGAAAIAYHPSLLEKYKVTFQDLNERGDIRLAEHSDKQLGDMARRDHLRELESGSKPGPKKQLALAPKVG
jgi:rod shape-determining protein MreB